MFKFNFVYIFLHVLCVSIIQLRHFLIVEFIILYYTSTGYILIDVKLWLPIYYTHKILKPNFNILNHTGLEWYG